MLHRATQATSRLGLTRKEFTLWSLPLRKAGEDRSTGIFVIPNPCSWTPGPTPQQGIGQSMSCFGNAGAGSLIPIPNTRLFNWDMTFGKAFPLKGEKRQLIFRAEMYNIFNHTQFTAANIGPQYSWPSWQQGILVQTNANLGRYTAAANPRQMSMSLRVQF